MKICDIYNFEKNRDFNKDKYVIRFIRNGNWWSAYEWSAYLAHFFPNKISDDKKLSFVAKHYSVLNDDLIYVGLQKKSFMKYFPGLCDTDDLFIDSVEYVDVDTCKFFEDNNVIFCDNFNYEMLLSEIKTNLLKDKTIINSEECNFRINSIIDDILNYDITNKTMVENTIFLNNIQIRLRKFKE